MNNLINFKVLFFSLLANWPRRVTFVIILLSILVPIAWFPANKIILNGDPYFVLDPARAFIERWSLWQEKMNLGAEVKVEVASLIQIFLQALPTYFGFNERSAEIFHFTFWFILPGITMALFMASLCRRLRISEWAIPPTVVFYLFNLYRMVNFGDNNHFVVYATIPLLLLILNLVFDCPDKWKELAIKFALATLLSAQSGTNPPMYAMLWIAVFVYGLGLSLIDRHNWRLISRFWLLALVLTILFNIFWIVPFIQLLTSQTGLVSAGNLNWLAGLSQYTSFNNVIRLIGAWGWFDLWQGERYTPFAVIYEVRWLYNLALVPAVIAFFALIFKRGRQPLVISLLVITIIGLVFAQGTHPPLSGFFTWCVNHIPFFWAFRSPWYKFSNLEVFGLAVLIGVSISLLVDFFNQKKDLAVLSIPAVILPIIIFLVIANPMMDGLMWTKPHNVHNLAPAVIDYPNSIKQAANWLNNQPGTGAIGLLPYQGAAIYRSGLSSMIDPIVNFSRRPVLFRGDRIGYVAGNRPGASHLYFIFKENLYEGKPAAETIARLLGIEYIVQRNDLKFEFYNDSDSPEFIRTKLANLPNFQLVKTFNGLEIYQLKEAKENAVFATNVVQFNPGDPVDSLAIELTKKQPNDPFPAIFYGKPIIQTNQPLVDQIVSTVKKESKLPELTVKKQGSRLTVTGQADQPFVLVLNQSMSKFWRAKSRSAEIQGPVVANGYAPAWLVKPSGEFTIKIDYYPQRYFALAAVISALAILLSSFWLITKCKQLLLPHK